MIRHEDGGQHAPHPGAGMRGRRLLAAAAGLALLAALLPGNLAAVSVLRAATAETSLFDPTRPPPALPESARGTRWAAADPRPATSRPGMAGSSLTGPGSACTPNSSGDPIGDLIRAAACDRAGERESALVHWQRLGAGSLLAAYAREAAAAGRAGALATAETALALGAESPELWLILARTREREGQARAALAAYERAAQLGSRSPEGYRRQAALLLAEGRIAQARAVAERALELDPDSREAGLTYAAVLEAAHDRDRAEAIYAGLAARFPRDAWILALRAHNLAQAGQVDQARALAALATALAPANRDVWVNAAWVAEAAGDEAGAITAYEQATAADPGTYWIHMLLAQAYERAGRLEQSLAAYRRAARLRPDLIEAVAGAERIRHALAR